MTELIALRRSESYFDGRGMGTRRFNEYIDELTSQVNTTTAATEEINAQLSSHQQLISQLFEVLKKQEKTVTTDEDYTAKPFDLVVCVNTSAIDVTAPINPMSGDIFNVKRTDAEVTVIGIIDGVTDKVINVQYWSMKLLFNGTEWVAI